MGADETSPHDVRLTPDNGFVGGLCRSAFGSAFMSTRPKLSLALVLSSLKS